MWTGKRYENDKCGRKLFWKRSTAPFSFENGLVWTGPKRSPLILLTCTIHSKWMLCRWVFGQNYSCAVFVFLHVFLALVVWSLNGAAFPFRHGFLIGLFFWFCFLGLFVHLFACCFGGGIGVGPAIISREETHSVYNYINIYINCNAYYIICI